MSTIYARLDRQYGTKLIGVKRQQMVRKLTEPLLEATKCPSQRRQAKRRPRVVIIGAGFGGLMAGFTLAHECEVTIFESRERVGGRVWTRNRSSGVVEAGGELIGYNHPLWLALGKRFRLGFSLFTQDSNFDTLDLDMPLYLGGRKISDQQSLALYKQMKKAFKRLADRSLHVHRHAPWLTHDAEALDQQSMANWIDSLECSDLTKLAIEDQFANDAGTPTDRQSLLANMAMIHGGAMKGHPSAFFTQTETLRCSEGNQSLAEHLAEEIREVDGVIHLSSPVDAVHVDKEGVTVELQGGSRHLADYVVLAIPPSLWPGQPFARIRITPELTPDHHISMGTAVKYLSPLKGRFWIGKDLAPSATDNRLGITWEGTDNQIESARHEVQLTVFAGSAPAHAAMRAWQQGGRQAVDKFYDTRIGRVYSDYADNVTTPREFIAWPADPWTGAGYSAPAPGETMRAGPLLNSAFHKRMYFAGEHTCFAFSGYMEGALQSGHRAGNAILRAIKRGRRRRSR